MLCWVNRCGCLNMVHTGHAEPTNYSGYSPGHWGHFGGSHARKTQNFGNFPKFGILSYFEGSYGKD
jgi:hypothetical protein